MSERDLKLLLEDMLESVNKIRKYTIGKDLEKFFFQVYTQPFCC